MEHDQLDSDTGEVRECPICKQYHHEDHHEGIREARRQAMEKINASLTYEQRSAAIKKGLRKKKKNTR